MKRETEGMGTKLAKLVLRMLKASGPRRGPRVRRSKYMPHQGPREMARRVRQMARLS